MTRGLVRLLISGALLGLLLFLVPWEQVTVAAARMTPGLYLMALAGYFVGHAMGAVKWNTLVSAARRYGGRLTVRDTAGCYSAGLFANLFLPTVVGGDVVRAGLAVRALGRPEAVVLGSIADRLIDFAGLGLLIAAGAVLAGAGLAGWGWPLAAIAALVGIATGVMVLPFLLRRRLAGWPPRFRRRIGRALVALRHLGRSPGTAAVALGLSLSMQSLFIVVGARLGQAVGAEAPLAVWFVVWPLAKAAGMLPVSLGGLGVRDAALTTLLVPFGVPAAVGLVASLAWQAVLVGGSLIAGLVALVLRPGRASRAHHQRATGSIRRPTRIA
ncbi:MAG TPA: lysylphosphatidylglycerol synthase transmembrane domain-containing protein [Longimicrobiales bacterium]|nr:lysylphosphatidylglycerol synthase transmembrane domain-containing protein [Longimicrobiales bacterium]